MTQPQIDDHFKRPLYMTVKALSMAEIPLLVGISDDTLMTFLEQLTSVLPGVTLYSGSPDATSQLVATFGYPDTVFLVVEDVIEGTMSTTIGYYLRMRDAFAVGNPIVEEQFEDHPLQEDHRLVLLASRDVFIQLQRDRGTRLPRVDHGHTCLI